MSDRSIFKHRESLVRFGDFEADLRSFELRRQGVKVAVQGQPLQLLFTLLQRPGELVTREELAEALWPEQPYLQLDDGLNTAVSKLRQALEDQPACPHFVETVPRRGYRFVGELEREAPSSYRSPEGSRSHRRSGAMLALGGVAVVVVSVVGALIWRDDHPDNGPAGETVVPTTTEGIRSVAVLPLLNLSNDPDQQYFSDGMTEALINDLGHMSSLRVTSRTSSMRYRNTSLSLPEIARELGVDAVVEGSVQLEGGTVRISAKLIDAATDRQLWGDAFEHELAGVLRLQSEVAGSVAGAIAATVSTGETSLPAGTREVNPETYEAYLRGKHFIDKGTPESFAKGMAYLQRAVDLDPAEPLAYAGLAGGNVMLGHATADAEYLLRAKAAAQRALELDGSSPEAHAVQAMVAMYLDRDWDRADRAFRRAIELNPSQAEIHIHYAFLLVLHGRYAEAAAHVELARRLDPLSPSIAVFRAEFYWPLGRYEEAEEAALQALELNPGFPHAHAWLGQIYRRLGRHEEAVEHARVAAEGDPRWMPYLGIVLVEAGLRDEARALLEELVATAQDRILVELASFQAAYGDLSGAMATLERADEAREFYLPWIGSYFEFGELTGDPRFQEILARMGLEVVQPQLLAAARSSR